MIVLAGLCVLIGLAAPLWPPLLQPAVAVIVPENLRGGVTASASQTVGPLTGIVFGSYILLGLIVLIMFVRRKLLAGRRVEQAVTWDCGYAAPTPRMQYTASSFARPLVLLFRLFLQPRDEIHPPHGLFPKHAALHTHAPTCSDDTSMNPCSSALPGLPRSCAGCRRGAFRYTCSTSP